MSISTRIFTCALLLSVANTAHTAPTQYPLTIDNCGVQITFDAAPKNVVSIGQSATEILYALGAGNQMAGTSLWYNDVLPEYADINTKVERIADNTPSFEAVVNKRPGFVPTAFGWQIGPQGAVGTREQFADLNIPTYVMPSDCEGKDNTIGGDGTRLAAFDISSVYKGIEQIAAIMDRQEKGNEIIADLKERHKTVAAKIKSLKLDNPSALVWYSSPDLEMDPYVAGRKGIPSWMLEQVGLSNVIESDEEWPTVGWESIAKTDPTVIVIARMTRNRFPADDYNAKLEFLKSDPVTSQMQAVKENRIIILDVEAMQHSIRVIPALEILSDNLAALEQ